MNIRPFKTADRKAVVELWTAVFGDADDHNSPERSLTHKLDFGDDLLFVAAEGGEILGTVMGGYDGHRGWVYSLAVAPQHRRQGVATALMRHLEAELQKLGCPKLNLQVRADNRQVVAFYESLGYAVEERVSMGKRLGEA